VKKGRQVLLGVIAVLLVVQGAFLQGVLWPTWKKRYVTSNLTNSPEAPGLDPGQMLAALAGFREMIAGILWVRADAFFDQGNYDAILPLIRLVTILDPHQIDVYATGIWHIGYNFTDEEQRSDRRYLPSAIALGTEGANNNKETYELFFETGWLWMHKIEDLYPKAVYWMEQANLRKDIAPARRNMLAKAYEKDGQVEKMLDLYYKLYDEALNAHSNDPAYQSRTQSEVIENNLDNLLVRMVQRGYMAKKMGIFEQGDYDTRPPFDVGFSAKVTVPEANILKIEGTWNVLPLGTRIRVVLRDANFANAIPGGVVWDAVKGVNLDPDKDSTYMQDALYVRNQHFSKKIDMSKDPTMYPFRGKDYILEFYYNPRNAPPHIQDKFGWNGDGMTDKNFLKTDLEGREGVRCMYAKLELTRDMIRRQGEYADKVPQKKTDNYKETSTATDQDVIIIPSLRGGK
jgi:hypothetical protein